MEESCRLYQQWLYRRSGRYIERVTARCQLRLVRTSLGLLYWLSWHLDRLLLKLIHLPRNAKTILIRIVI